MQAQRDVVSEARSAHAPTGFLNVEWLMSMSRVKALRPDASAEGSDKLTEFAQWLDRPVLVVYDFTDDYFLLVTIAFVGSSSADDFAKTQRYLSTQYQGIQPPREEAGYLARSKSKIGRFAVNHELRVFGSTPTEQVQFYRTK
jgi:hypothetical protein